MPKATSLTAAALLMAATSLFAQRTSDIQNGKDYPLVSRFSGSVMEWQQVKNFDKYYLLSRKDNKLQPYEIDGKITRIQYSSQPSRSVFEIYKSYETALKNAGFEILLTLDKSNCGTNLSEQLYSGEFNGLNALPAGETIKPDYKEGEFAYLAAKKKISGKEVYVVTYVTNWSFPLITFDAIEVQAMDKGLVSVKDLASGLAQDGHIAVYDIHFDTGKSQVKPESSAALKIIAEYMKTHPGQKVIIVGHTDNTGSFDANVALSKSRANAVIDVLTNTYGVSGSQLRAWGSGSTAPVATNSTPGGRAKNRRVDIVEE